MRESTSLMTEKSTFHNQGETMAWQSEICTLITAQPGIINGAIYIIKQSKCQRKGQALLGGGWGGGRAGPPIIGIPFVNLPNSRLPKQ